MRYFLQFLLISSLSLGAYSCGDKSSESKKIISDLPFHKAENAKAYADVVLKSIRTGRDEPIFQEFSNKTGINQDSLNMLVGMYSTGIRGRKDWEYIDVFGDAHPDATANDIIKAADGFDYAWLDQSGRLGIQIKIVPIGTSKGFELERIEFRSRLDVIASRAVPGGPISDYQKLDYDWEAKMERMKAKKSE